MTDARREALRQSRNWEHWLSAAVSGVGSRIIGGGGVSSLSLLLLSLSLPLPLPLPSLHCYCHCCCNAVTTAADDLG